MASSLLFVAAVSAAACGGSAEFTTDPTFISGAGHGSGGYGNGAGRASNPPAIGHGGQGSSNPPFLNGGGYGNEAGSITNQPPVAFCPGIVPVNGSACISSPNGSYTCGYGSSSACTATLALCTGGVWLLRSYAVDCGGFLGKGGSGGVVPIGEAGAGGTAGEGPAAPDPLVYCPQVMPTLGAYCYKPSSVTSYRCDYAVACGAYEATCNGQWQLAYDGAPTDSCAAGAPAN